MDTFSSGSRVKRVSLQSFIVSLNCLILNIFFFNSVYWLIILQIQQSQLKQILYNKCEICYNMSNSKNQTFNHTSPSFLEQAKSDAQNGMFGNKQKKMFYQFINQIVNNQFPLKVYFALIIIQHLQIIGYLTHSTLQYSSIGLQVLSSISNIINPQYYLRTVPNAMNILIPVGLGFVIIHFLLFMIGYISHRKKTIMLQYSNSTSKKSRLSLLLHWTTIFMCTILTIPIAFPSMTSIYCSDGDLYNRGHQCYKTFHFFLIIASLVNLAWLIFIHLVYSFLYFNRNPFSKDIFSMSSPIWNFVKFLAKIVPTAYSYIDAQFKFIYLYVFGIAACYIIYLGFGRFLMPYQRYNKDIQKFTIYVQTNTAIIGIVFIFQIFFVSHNDTTILFLSSLILGFPLGRLLCKLIIDRKKELLQQINKTEKQNCEHFEKYLIHLIYDIQQNQSNQIQNFKEKQIGLFKIIKYHNVQCTNLNCHCHQFIQNYAQSQESILLFYRVLIDIIDKLTQQNKKAYSLIILKSQIQYFKFKNIIKAAFTLSQILNQKTSLFEDYLIIGLLYEYNKLKEDNSNIEKYRVFSNFLSEFEIQAIKTASFYQQYWLQLIEQNSSLEKLMKLLQQANISKEQMQKSYNELIKIFPTNLRAALVYKQMQKQVLLNLDGFIKHQNQYKEFLQIQNQEQLLFYDPNNRIKFTSNEDLVIITSKIRRGNGHAAIKSDIFTGGCQIINITHNVNKLLGYFYKDLIGKNINRFLPKIYTKFHDQFIQAYLNRESDQIKPIQLTIYPLNSQGYIIETVLINKIMPSLDHGVVVISFIACPKQGSQQNCLIIYDRNSGLVDSMSQKAAKLLLGGKSKTNSISIPDHINDILPMWDITKQQHIQAKLNSQKDLGASLKNIILKRSDGPEKDKYTKVISFQLQFKQIMFSINSNQFTAELSEYIFGYRTLMQNAGQKQTQIDSNKNQIVFNQKLQVNKAQEAQTQHKIVDISNNFFQICESSKPLLQLSPNNLKAQDLDKQNLNFHSNSGETQELQRKKTTKKTTIANQIPQQYLRPIPRYLYYSYIIFQVTAVLGLLSLLLYEFAIISVSSADFDTNILIKHEIQDCQIDIIDLSNYLSQYLHATSKYSNFLSKQVNPQYLGPSLIQLQSEIDAAYKQLLEKQSDSILDLNDFSLNVSYFNGRDNVIQKNKLFTDATYQFISYYLDILSGVNLTNLSFNPNSLVVQYQDNILYIFKNSNNISQVFQQLNSVFTSFVLQFLNDGKDSVSLFLGIFIMLLLLSAIFETIFQGIIIKRFQDVSKIYKNIPILEIGKFPKKCQNFIKYVCPQEKSQGETQAIKIFNNLSDIVKPQRGNGIFNDQQKSILTESKVQYISFSQSPSIFCALANNLLYIGFFVAVGIIFSTFESSYIDKQIKTIQEWDSLTQIRDKLSKMAYFSNQYLNYGNQWNSNQIESYKTQLIHILESLDLLITKTTFNTLNSYKTNIYSLVQEFRFLVDSPTGIDMQKFFVNQQRAFNISAQLIEIEVYDLINNKQNSQSKSNEQVTQIFLITQLLYLVFFVWFGVYKKYKKYQKMYQISLKMYQTLGSRLQKIGIQNFKSNK